MRDSSTRSSFILNVELKTVSFEPLVVIPPPRFPELKIKTEIKIIATPFFAYMTPSLLVALLQEK